MNLYITLTTQVQAPVAARSKAWFCGLSIAGIWGLIVAGGVDVSVGCESCVLSDRGLCFGLITRPEESH